MIPSIGTQGFMARRVNCLKASAGATISLFSEDINMPGRANTGNAKDTPPTLQP
jgi:hypothetical protein